MKQTAVNFLYEFVQLQLTHQQQMQFEGLFQQAKEMEKEQIIQAITKTIIGSNVIYGNEYPEVIHTAEQYYNNTFKSE